MARLSVVAAVLALVAPTLALGDGKKKDRDGRKPAPQIIPAALIGEAKPSHCANCGNGFGGHVLRPGETVYPHGPGTFGARLDAELWGDDNECGPDGCPKPIGCGNHWTELKFIFGSCREFFGTAGATVGRGRATVEP